MPQIQWASLTTSLICTCIIRTIQSSRRLLSVRKLWIERYSDTSVFEINVWNSNLNRFILKAQITSIETMSERQVVRYSKALEFLRIFRLISFIFEQSRYDRRHPDCTYVHWGYFWRSRWIFSQRGAWHFKLVLFDSCL